LDRRSYESAGFRGVLDVSRQVRWWQRTVEESIDVEDRLRLRWKSVRCAVHLSNEFAVEAVWKKGFSSCTQAVRGKRLVPVCHWLGICFLCKTTTHHMRAQGLGLFHRTFQLRPQGCQLPPIDKYHEVLDRCGKEYGQS
jgi:hypothetical protein